MKLVLARDLKKARPLDPRDYVLFSYGGGGPLHGCELAPELHIPMVVVPLEPGNFSAVGMLLADARLDTNRTFVADLDETSLARLEAMFIERPFTSGLDCRSDLRGTVRRSSEEYGSTTLVGPNDSFVIGELRKIRIDWVPS